MLKEAWALSPSMALQPEPFGAHAYHFGERCDVRSALVVADVPAAQHSAYTDAMAGLAHTDMIRPRSEGVAP